MGSIKPVKLGNSGLKISPILVGCMSYGSKKWQEWVIEDKQEVFKILKHCYDSGLRTFDTADFYSNGISERLLGEFLKTYNINRETVVILSKVFYPVDDTMELNPSFDSVENELNLSNQRGLSRKHILAGVSNSVRRLGTYIDVLQIHRLDHDTPMKEIMRALNDVVERGDARYIGASSMLATEFAELQFIAEKYDWFQFISSQSCYNLLYREDERELIPFAKKHNIGLIPWSPNARGLLTRPLRQTTERSKKDWGFKVVKLDKLEDSDREIISRVEAIGKEKGVSMAAVSMAWVLHKGCYPIVGLNSVERVDEAKEALSIKLTDDEILHLEEPYKTKASLF
ncbi:hypothetical protein ZYGR_0A00140 [Zygosaccharomyces rouxii]|uniref:ZYRO0A00286p n=2 Tax=Zygosaccharomyces rouxii TaxID=4956 RepID=C5DP45_ZYGRC|nr:uncharacterized protein ZYRO0A00286g [Zygosaccharomyces rouxii]KAH9199026.1 NADP-dependent oxidoreductase domain-containing protein [Zygosaccharomyces rouxii]GAV46425.1 hypothetical protein ZYGR_0A00140 [Zygosaccharomyces rouxii]CAR25456.1 ZYRO0A00286p [Zygosaccharomyces rouxii]